ncbi:MAG TPA: V-type ATP synthase subunit B [Gemmatimonadaceae bacterium]|nr:V-type ATP synthase subunit B [Gemmatimonadaceae bacterium]
MSTIERRYRGAASVAGPLLVLDGARGVALGEWVRVETPGQADRRGQVIEASDRSTVVQLLDDTVGLAPTRAAVVLTGRTASTVVGRELLGRVFDGHGAPADGLPPPVGEAVRSIEGVPMNPVRRARPNDFIETGISAIDAMNTLVRGQKLPIFGGAGLPSLDVAARIVTWARAPRGEPFAVVFAGIGITARETREFVDRVRTGGALPRTVLYLNEAAAPSVERILAPRLALTAAEFLAFDVGMHVLVVLADMTNYCEALRELATAREEIPGRRGYPGYMYTDLASLYERAGILQGRPGSITQIPVVTMPDDDLTHPIPDLTGYITEGQVVLSRDLHRAGVFPPIDVLPSLSRLMNSGIGAGRTRAEHREWSDQLYASYARGRDARSMAAIVGESGLGEADRRALALAERFEREFVHQPEGARRLDDTFAAGWRLLDVLPRGDLVRLSDATLATHAGGGAPAIRAPSSS